MVLGQPILHNSSDTLFRPAGLPMFLGFQISPVACLDCGYVGACLCEDERLALEKKLHES